MTTNVGITLRNDDKMSEIASISIEHHSDEDNNDVQRVYLKIGINIISMNWKQFEQLMKIMIERTTIEYQRRERAKIKQPKMINLEVGDVIELEDKIE